jgi:hypothetical protein
LRNLLDFFDELPLYITLFFSLIAFNIVSLLSVLFVLPIIFCGEILLWSYLFGVLEASCTWMGISFSRFEKYFAIIC